MSNKLKKKICQVPKPHWSKSCSMESSPAQKSLWYSWLAHESIPATNVPRIIKAQLQQDNRTVYKTHGGDTTEVPSSGVREPVPLSPIENLLCKATLPRPGGTVAPLKI